MTAKEYLIKKVNEIGMQFTDLTIRYAYDSETNFHIIEVDPGAIRRNMDFAKLEALLYQEFYALYHEDLLITEPSVLTKSIKTIYEVWREVSHENIIEVESDLSLPIHKKFDMLKPSYVLLKKSEDIFSETKREYDSQYTNDYSLAA